MTNVVITLLFAALMAVSLGTAAVIGGREGRRVAALYLLAALATWGARYLWPLWNQPNLQVFIIDTALLVGLYIVTINSHRYWPIWFTGLHLLTVLSHLQALVAGIFGARLYFALESVWSLPKLLVLLIGVILDWEYRHERGRHHRRR